MEDKTNMFSLAFPIEKKTSDLRIVIDYRKTNKHIIDEPYEIPKIFETLQLLERKAFFTKIDLKNGFDQISIDKQSSKITGFMMFNKIYTYKRIPFGIKSGPNFFQKYVCEILSDVNSLWIHR